MPQPQQSGEGPWQIYPPEPPSSSQPPQFEPQSDEYDQLAPRRPRFTWSPAGLAVGLIGVVVQALFTYLVTFVPSETGHWQLALDAERTVVLLGTLNHLGTFPIWQVPLIVSLPFMPILELLVVIVLGLPRARTVSPRLVSRSRIGWIVIFAVATTYAVVATVVFGPGGAPQLLLYWLGDALVVLGVALPHIPD